MKRPLASRWMLAAVALLAPQGLLAQSATPEIRRAIPVTPAATPVEVRAAEPVIEANQPPWMQRVPRREGIPPAPDRVPPPPVRAALPADPPEPPRAAPAVPTPAPYTPPPAEVAVPAAPREPEVRRALPAVPALAPATTAPAQDPTGLQDPREELRAAPINPQTDPAAALFDRGNAYYARKLYDMAIPEYQQFIELRSNGPERQAALFRLAESLRSLGRNEEARLNYERVLAEFGSGDFVGPTSYRLGEIYFASTSYEMAADQFSRAAQHVRDPKLRLAARFYQARALEGARRTVDALAVYREVAAVEDDNPYREMSLLELAEGDEAAGLKDSALRQYEALAQIATNPVVRASVGVKAGLLALDLGDFNRARSLLGWVAGMKEIPEWRQAAELGLLRTDYESEKYPEVVSRGQPLLNILPRSTQPQALLLVANARRQMGEHATALALYDRILAEYPDRAEAADARFNRLVSLVAVKDPRALPSIAGFADSATDPSERARARLLQAELLFAEGQYEAASPLYEEASLAAPSAKHRAEALYKYAWTQNQLKKYDSAIQAFTRFLIQNPSHPLAASAYLQRATAQTQTGQIDEAIEDLSTALNRFPQAKERETVMLQRALLLGQRKRNAEMIRSFEELVQEFPQTKSAAQANFWIGYARFDAQKFAEALPALEKARELDPAQYGERATLRILLSHYYLQNREAAAAEARRLGTAKTPVEVRRWIGLSSLSAGDSAAAAEFLRAGGLDDDTPDETRLALAEAELKQKQFEPARLTLEALLPRLQDPKVKSGAHLMLAEAMLGLNRPADALKHAEEAQILQPEGKGNARARMANGRALLAQKRYNDAARAFMSVALLYDDPEITPQALQLAADAYAQAGNKVDAGRARDELRRRYPPETPTAKPAAS